MKSRQDGLLVQSPVSRSTERGTLDGKNPGWDTQLDEAVSFRQWDAAWRALTECVAAQMGISSFAILHTMENGPADLAVALAGAAQDSTRLRTFLLDAASKGQTDVVKGLLALPGADPRHRDSEALEQAARNLHTETVRVLYGLSQPDLVAQRLADDEAWAAVDGLLQVAAGAGHALAHHWLTQIPEQLPQTEAMARQYRSGGALPLIAPGSRATRRGRARP